MPMEPQVALRDQPGRVCLFRITFAHHNSIYPFTYFDHCRFVASNALAAFMQIGADNFHIFLIHKDREINRLVIYHRNAVIVGKVKTISPAKNIVKDTIHLWIGLHQFFELLHTMPAKSRRRIGIHQEITIDLLRILCSAKSKNGLTIFVPSNRVWKFFAGIAMYC